MSQRTSPPQLSFSSGEMSPLLRSRPDYQAVQTGLARCNGFLPLRQGGITRAPGSLFDGHTRSDAPGRLLSFVFAENDALTLEMTDGIMRVWRYGALVETGGAPYELAIPYDEAAIARLNWVQSADVIYLADGVLPIQRLARKALDDWEIGPAEFPEGPFRVPNGDESHVIEASAATGTVTLTASDPLFAADHVGSLLRLEPEAFDDIAVWTGMQPVADVPLGTLLRFDGNIYELIAGSSTGFNPPVHEKGDEKTDHKEGTVFRFISDGVGVVRITAITDATTATAEVVRRLPPPVVADGTWVWSEGAWSARYGYPAVLEIHDQRLVAAATPSEPRTMWFSAAGDFSDMAPGIEADDPFVYTIAGESTVNRILWLARGRAGLHIGALGEEYSVRSDTRGQVVGPTTARFGKDSGIGSRAARPIVPDGNPIFISRDGRRVVEIGYVFEVDGNRHRELSLRADHLGRPGFREIVWQDAPVPMAWLRRGDGTLAAMTHDPGEDVLGWAPCSVAGGFVESIAVTPDACGSRDVLTMIVRREIEGETRRFVERQAPVWILDREGCSAGAVHLFAAAVFDVDPPRETFVVPHLSGRTVHAWTDQGRFGPVTLDDGPDPELVLPQAVSRCVVGLFDETHLAETFDIVAAAPDGSSIGRRKRLHGRGGVSLLDSCAGRVKVIEREFAQPERTPWAETRLIKRPVGSGDAEPVTGVSPLPLPSGHAEEIALRFRPEGGAPLTILAVVPTVQEGGV